MRRSVAERGRDRSSGDYALGNRKGIGGPCIAAQQLHLVTKAPFQLLDAQAGQAVMS